ncbi:hypothetical protein JQ557_22340 [Bradyrhizobium sp. U87765 SZCCT0131]|uniref:hypothetical protein n=1 Tax=unclassified Bradyrhizobium TaxID=2631580 RepID=UPI001BADDC3C|nr:MULTISPECIES: hypothetical protein [unclassified Bradyrhizobium]MBR1220757.1 hypothetical protein [Bradyrhizobium sp. U87765 SZCCT0131]MBR1260423.1 hypothetical protein [Bradyrhizobium sp. U87765 SZCCT0134]MBR1307328.1 hypothetical protein [Bradyrhizobium sp. U87765 SZCCT0110]MBR1321282.1 hypothetical protein [Bradyrhizobium sp. U87765 SZCCT0109]MBR1349595.1 hypothetical protein [Bradyrhizobium sp. U87765 SZCCT0048]
MKKLLFAFWRAAASTSSAFAAGITPEAAVTELYAAYGQGCNHSEQSGLNDALAGRLFDADLARTYRRAKSIDADFFVAGQDWCIVEPVAVTTASQTPSKAQVLAVVKLDDDFGQGKPRIRTLKITFALSRSADGWRISDASDGKASAKKDWRNSR